MSEKKSFYYLIDSDDSAIDTGYFDTLAEAQIAWKDSAEDGNSIAVVCVCAGVNGKWVKA